MRSQCARAFGRRLCDLCSEKEKNNASKSLLASLLLASSFFVLKYSWASTEASCFCHFLKAGVNNRGTEITAVSFPGTRGENCRLHLVSLSFLYFMLLSFMFFGMTLVCVHDVIGLLLGAQKKSQKK